jgi:flagellar biosynthesis chaperone FliJ
METEFRVLSVRRRLHELSREELEEFLTEALSTMTKLAHQLTQLRDYAVELEGKIEEN